MIDPNNIIKYNRSREELEELAVFCVLVASRKADKIARSMDGIRGEIKYNLPCDYYVNSWFSLLRKAERSLIEYCIYCYGIGLQHQKAQTLYDLARAGLNLSTCSVSDLETIKGIGPKTSRFFISCSREGVRHAILDTHILRWMRDQGIENVPKSTPSGKKYLDLEQTYLKMVPEGMSPGEFNLQIWREYSNARPNS